MRAAALLCQSRYLSCVGIESLTGGLYIILCKIRAIMSNLLVLLG